MEWRFVHEKRMKNCAHEKSFSIVFFRCMPSTCYWRYDNGSMFIHCHSFAVDLVRNESTDQLLGIERWKRELKTWNHEQMYYFSVALLSFRNCSAPSIAKMPYSNIVLIHIAMAMQMDTFILLDTCTAIVLPDYTILCRWVFDKHQTTCRSKNESWGFSGKLYLSR